jgi:hypothetical protein
MNISAFRHKMASDEVIRFRSPHVLLATYIRPGPYCVDDGEMAIDSSDEDLPRPDTQADEVERDQQAEEAAQELGELTLPWSPPQRDDYTALYEPGYFDRPASIECVPGYDERVCRKFISVRPIGEGHNVRVKKQVLDFLWSTPYLQYLVRSLRPPPRQSPGATLLTS